MGLTMTAAEATAGCRFARPFPPLRLARCDDSLSDVAPPDGPATHAATHSTPQRLDRHDADAEDPERWDGLA